MNFAIVQNKSYLYDVRVLNEGKSAVVDSFPIQGKDHRRAADAALLVARSRGGLTISRQRVIVRRRPGIDGNMGRPRGISLILPRLGVD